ncbi:MAG: UDP-N-acetylmuramoyl-L-alanyl-D-glutamate--2,6-diaminopimelate ligase [bacterium]|nr:MAG: UDP-N-acetylmuramoyl-L-alanyl-D-glutamate--2,6-diaminopimelate ligase [bacterium]
MKLSDLIGGIEGIGSLNGPDVEISGISTDTRTIAQGDLFVAVRGETYDGHEFLSQAVAGGASALVAERRIETTVPVVVVKDSTAAAALCAKRFFSDPSSDITLVGITGTNGKTSTSFLLRSILQRAVGKTGIIGTVGFGSSIELAEATHTTPDSVNLYRIISEFRGAGCRAVVMEVSSHALTQKRITGLEFDVGLFTNITRDHLDYHGTFERYVAAKEMLAHNLIDPNRCRENGTLVYNLDNPSVVSIAGRFSGMSISYGFSREADVRAERLGADLSGTSFELFIGSMHFPVSLELLGSFSAHNALAAATAAHALGAGPEDIVAGLEAVSEVPGRFQVISTDVGPKVIVDYAHTPDALEGLLTFCRELGPKRILTVFGCGGDRDRGKRPMMGRIASELSDAVYITDDNPRTEDPETIVREVLTGVHGVTPVVIRDRREAIHRVVRDAGVGDLVVIAGKGHEKEQILADRRIPFSDADEAMDALRRAEVGNQG